MLSAFLAVVVAALSSREVIQHCLKIAFFHAKIEKSGGSNAPIDNSIDEEIIAYCDRNLIAHGEQKQ